MFLINPYGLLTCIRKNERQQFPRSPSSEVALSINACGISRVLKPTHPACILIAITSFPKKPVQWYVTDLIPTPNLPESGKSFCIPAKLHKRLDADNIVYLELKVQNARVPLQKGVKQCPLRKHIGSRWVPHKWTFHNTKTSQGVSGLSKLFLPSNQLSQHSTMWQLQTYTTNRQIPYDV